MSSPPDLPEPGEIVYLSSLSHHGVTWTFSRDVPVGRFITGDFYVVGPATITSISPPPTANRNGSVLNLPPHQHKSGFDDRVEGGRFDASLRAQLPIQMVPGDSLASSISVDVLGQTENWLREGNNEKSLSPVKSISILTCLDEAAPADAFRPSYSDTSNTIYRLGNVNRNLIPRLSSPVTIDTGYMRMFADRLIRPWVDICYYAFDAQVEYMAMYGREKARVAGIVSLLLMLDLEGEQEEVQEQLLIGMLQRGIDLWGVLESGYPGWYAHGGFGSGRKWPIIFAGMLFNDPAMRAPTITYPNAKFGEDMMTAYYTDLVDGGPVWYSGEEVVYAGHMGVWDGVAVSSEVGWGPYEHIPPADWPNYTGEGYRRCCTSFCWVGEALAARLMNAEVYWAHPAFFDYVDRWMNPEGDLEYVNYLYEISNGAFDRRADWAREGQAWDEIVNEMWATYR